MEEEGQRFRVLELVGVLPRSGSASEQPFVADQIESLRRLDVDLDVLDLAKHGQGFAKYVAGVRELRRLLGTNHYDLIHAHFSYCGWVARFQRGVPVIVSFMGKDLLGRPNKNGRQTLRGYFDMFASQVLARCVDQVIVKSESMAKLMGNKVEPLVLPNGVDFEAFKPRDRAAARAELGVDSNDHLVLFGANPEDLVKNYPLAEAAIRVLQRQNRGNYVLLPFYNHSHPEVCNAMNAADVLVLTSFWEGSPNIVKEAMACDLPVVSVRVGDVQEITAGARNCLLAQYDPMDMAAKIDAVVRSGERSDGRQHIAYLRLEVVALRLLDIYRRVLRKRRQHGFQDPELRARSS